MEVMRLVGRMLSEPKAKTQRLEEEWQRSKACGKDGGRKERPKERPRNTSSSSYR